MHGYVNTLKVHIRTCNTKDVFIFENKTLD